MKLKNIFMCVAATMTVLCGCSDNEPILNIPEEPAPTTMSIRIDADGTIISKAETDQTISNLYILIFEADGDYYKTDSIIGTGDSVTEGAAENVDIEVAEGAHQVLVLANVKNKSDIEGKKLSDVLAATTKLDSEADGNLTMSSEVMQVSFMAAVKNKIGYTTAEIGTGERNAYPGLTEPVKLYRSVARIQLSQLTLATSVDDAVYGEPVSFKLDSIFIANAKGYSQLASTSNTTLSIEATAAPTGGKLWWYGDWSGFDTNDVLKKTTEAETHKWTGLGYSEEGGILSLNLNGSYPESANVNTPIGKYFYVYENEIAENDGKGVGYQTLLVLKGDYTYKKDKKLFEADTPVDGQTNTYVAKDRYYAITVNPDEVKKNDTNKILRDHKGVIRNTIYDLIVTINGPGSNVPYQPDTNLYYNAQVVVADWEKVPVGGEVN